jgi:hypothetical protein
MKVRVICTIFFLSYITPCAYSQNIDSLAHPMNKNGFSISVNFINNYYSGKQITTFDQRNRSLFYNNSSLPGGDTAFYYQIKEVDTQTFGINASYNKRVSKKIGLSIGLGFYQKKRRSDYLNYIHKYSYLPDLKYSTETTNSIFIPLRLNYYYKRLVLGAGPNFNIILNTKNIDVYKDGSKVEYSNDNLNPQTREYIAFFLQETIAFQLIKKHGFYLHLSAEQNSHFYQSGYNNWFMLGATYIF